MDSLVQLARAAIETYVRTGGESVPDCMMDAIPSKKAGAFVSIHTLAGDLRGCIGTILPVCDSLANEIVQNAISACSHDRRFAPVRAEELESLKIKVDVLSEPEPIDSIAQLDPQKYGVIVTASKGRRGVLLPALDGVGSAEDQIEICRKKGGIGAKEQVTLQRFTVERHH
jgi:AmmeMemoRadiSam system protein A